MKLLIFLLVILFPSGISVAGGLSVSRAYYRDTNSSLHLLLINRGKETIQISPPVVDGVDLAQSGRSETRPRNVLWYRCRPDSIPPGGMADLIIVLPAPTDKTITVELTASSGERIRKDIACIPEPMRFQAIRFSKDLRKIDCYVRWSDASEAIPLKKILIDNQDVTQLVTPKPLASLDGLTYLRINLPDALTKGSCHVFEVVSSNGHSCYYQIRAIPAEFLIGVYGTPSEKNIADWASHGINHYISFGALSDEILDSLDKFGISAGSRFIPEPLVDRKAGNVVPFEEATAEKILTHASRKKSFLYHHLVDEPDVSDYYAERWIGSSGMELAARAEFCEEHDPEHFTFVQLDNTFRSRNFHVYGESADILATHRYSLGNYLKSEAGQSAVERLPFMEDLVETMERFRMAVEPRPFYMVTQFFNLGPARAGRAPTIEEMRLQCYAMVAKGARGVLHYIHSGSGGGGEGARDRKLWDAMTGLHVELKRVGELVSMGTPAPVEWIKSDSPQLQAQAVLCGNQIVVVLINRDHQSALKTFSVKPVDKAAVTLRVPPWIDASKVRLSSFDNTPAPAIQRKNRDVVFTVYNIRDARCYCFK